jgi:hypothetical protein
VAGVDIHKVVEVKTSPPCETFSLADASNITRSNYYRDHSDPNKPPRSLASCKTAADIAKRKKAIGHGLLLKDLVGSAIQDRKKGLKYELLIENPVGSLRQRPFMRGEELEEMLVRRTVNYCAYGKPYCKQTDFWTTLDSWVPTGRTGNALCNDGQCGQGTRNERTGRFNHTEVIAGPDSKKPSGQHYKKTVWELPVELTREYMKEFCSKHDSPEGSIVLDLYSGGESWRKATEEAGLIYIPVDIRKFKWSDDDLTK